jgi:hypothetical protein
LPILLSVPCWVVLKPETERKISNTDSAIILKNWCFACGLCTNFYFKNITWNITYLDYGFFGNPFNFTPKGLLLTCPCLVYYRWIWELYTVFFLAIMNCVAMAIPVRVPWRTCTCISFKYLLRSEISNSNFLMEGLWVGKRRFCFPFRISAFPFKVFLRTYAALTHETGCIFLLAIETWESQSIGLMGIVHQNLGEPENQWHAS